MDRGCRRCQRFPALVEDGVVKVLTVEPKSGQATCTIGEVLVDRI